MAINSLNVTISGKIMDHIYDPDNCLRYIKSKNKNNKLIFIDWFEYFKNNIKEEFSLNLIQIETFQKQTYPIIEVNFIDTFKNKPWWWKLWFENIKDQYELKYKIIGEKILTKIKMRSGKIYYVDESYECIENALDACVWNAEMKEQL